MGAPAILLVEHLQRRFGDLVAVDDVGFEIHAGEVFSLLGPNGAGKSTTIALIAGLLRPDAGDALIEGHSIQKDALAAKAGIGVVPQDLALFPDLSARENLDFFGRMAGLHGAVLRTRVGDALAFVGLVERARDRVESFSGGMKRRLNIAAAVLHRPRLLILDEPTVGIDPQSRRHILDGVARMRGEGTAVLYTTHYMEEAEHLSNQVAIMDHGKIVARGTPAELRALVGDAARLEFLVSGDVDAATTVWASQAGVRAAKRVADRVHVLVPDPAHAVGRLLEALPKETARVAEVRVIEPDLEAVFLHLTGRALRDTA